jgi:hypothetical protein
VASTVQLADIGKWPQKVMHQYHSGIVQTIRTSLRMHAPALIQAAIAGVKPYQPVHTGDYKRSWKVVNITDGAFFYNPTIQAGIIERGRRPGVGVSRAGQEALARWAHLHGMDREKMSKRESRTRRRMRAGGAAKESFRFRVRWSQESRARGIAFLIARAIKRRGLPAKNVLKSITADLTSRVLNDVEAMIAKGPQS